MEGPDTLNFSKSFGSLPELKGLTAYQLRPKLPAPCPFFDCISLIGSPPSIMPEKLLLRGAGYY